MASKVEKDHPATAGKRFAASSVQKELSLAGTSRSIRPIGDHIAEALLTILFTSGIGTSDIQVFRLGITFLLRSLSHPLLLSKERIA